MFKFRVVHEVFVEDRVVLRWSFIHALLFSLPVIIPLMFPAYLLSEAGTIGPFEASGIPRNFFRGGSTNSVEDRQQREQGSGCGSP
jgi:hypothetical protein